MQFIGTDEVVGVTTDHRPLTMFPPRKQDTLAWDKLRHVLAVINRENAWAALLRSTKRIVETCRESDFPDDMVQELEDCLWRLENPQS